MTLPPNKKKALAASGTLNPHPESVKHELFTTHALFDPHDRAQVKYEMLRSQQVEGMSVTEACRQFGFSRESFYQIRSAFHQHGFSSLLPAKPGRKGPSKLKGKVLKFTVEQHEKNPELDPGSLAALIRERHGVEVHRTTVMRALKKNCVRRPHRIEWSASDDPVQASYESLRVEALERPEAPSELLQRVCQYGVASLFPGMAEEFPFVLYVHTVPRPPWTGKRDIPRETLSEVYRFLTQEITDDENGDLCTGVERASGARAHDWLSARGVALLCG